MNDVLTRTEESLSIRAVHSTTVSRRRVSRTQLPLGDDANNPEECLRAALYWAPGLAMQIPEDDWSNHGFCGALLIHFMKSLKSKGKLAELPKSLADLHKMYPGEFVAWATDPKVRVNFLAQQKIREVYSSVVEKITTCPNLNDEHEKIVEVELVKDGGRSALSHTIDSGADFIIPRFLLKEEVVKKEKALSSKPGLKYDEESDTLTVQLHNCSEEKTYSEVDPKGFTVSRKHNSKKGKKGPLVNFTLHGVRQMLQEQGAKRKSIKLEYLLKRLEHHYRRTYKIEVFGSYKVEELCKLIKDHQFTWWIPE